MAAVKELWNRCMVIMEQKLQNPVSMDVWLKQIRPVEITGEKATLSVPSSFFVVYRTNQHTAGINAHHRSWRKIGNSDTGLADKLLRLVIGVNTA